MPEEVDEVHAAIERQLQTALAAAAQFGQRLAVLRTQLAHQAQAKDAQLARELGVRFEAERGGARASFAMVYENSWWEAATPQQIADVYQTAIVWRDFDDEAPAAIDKIESEVQERYGVDVDQLGETPVDVDRADELEREREAAIATDEELTATQLLMAELAERDARERDAELQAAEDEWESKVEADFEQEWDTPERRSATLHRLAKADIDKDVTAAVMLADSDQALHPSAAVRSSGKSAGAARRPAKQAVRVQEQESR